MSQKQDTALKGCRVQFLEVDFEEKWEGVITGAVWEMDQAQYWVEMDDGSKLLVPATGIRMLKILPNKPKQISEKTQEQTTARILKLCKKS